MKQLALFVLGAFVLSATPSFAKNNQAYRDALKSVPAAEMPAKAAQMVKKAKARDWGNTTVGVVKAAVSISPASAPAVVGAVSRAVPEMASIAASTAAAEQPKQAAAISKAAAAAAPAKAGKIVTAVCREVPAQYRMVAVAAAEAAPTASREIVAGVGSAIPEMKAGLERSPMVLAGAPGVAKALDGAAPATTTPTTAAGSSAQGPAIGGPYIPISGTPDGISRANTEVVPPGGRDYAAP